MRLPVDALHRDPLEGDSDELRAELPLEPHAASPTMIFLAASVLALPVLPIRVNTSYSSGSPLTSYDPDRALLFARFSQAAYCSSSVISDWDCGPCKAADPAFVPKVFTASSVLGEGMQCFVGQAPGNDIVVSFRGSSNIENWIDNIDFKKKDVYPKCDSCEVHEGFYNAWLSVKDDVVAEVTRLHEADASARIFVTGHSLGAAVASLCATELGASSHSLGFPIAGV
jgi:hypothetical protein